MNDPEKKYWDSSCFICFLNEDEKERREICEDNLKHARSGDVEIWTSTWTIVEVIRPRRHGSAPLPEWGAKAAKAIEKEFPEAGKELEILWKRYQANDPAIKLSAEQIDKIKLMFEWDFIHLIDLDKRVADKAVELSRDCGLKPADAVHAASAVSTKGISALQRWDRDFEKVNHLITVEAPNYLSVEGPLLSALTVGPTPSDFALRVSETEEELEAVEASDGLDETEDETDPEDLSEILEEVSEVVPAIEKPKATAEGGSGENGS